LLRSEEEARAAASCRFRLMWARANHAVAARDNRQAAARAMAEMVRRAASSSADGNGGEGDGEGGGGEGAGGEGGGERGGGEGASYCRVVVPRFTTPVTVRPRAVDREVMGPFIVATAALAIERVSQMALKEMTVLPAATAVIVTPFGSTSSAAARLALKAARWAL